MTVQKKRVWKEALKTFVSSVTAVIIVNFTDPKGVTFSKEWFLHVLLAIFTLSVLNEARYWKSWADSKGEGNNNANNTSDTIKPITN